MNRGVDGMRTLVMIKKRRPNPSAPSPELIDSPTYLIVLGSTVEGKDEVVCLVWYGEV